MNLSRNILRNTAFALVMVTASLSPAFAKVNFRHFPEYYPVAWMQTSAEYKALCLQTYQAGMAMVNRLNDSQQFTKRDGKLGREFLVQDENGQTFSVFRPLALVFDIDETVIDNSPEYFWAITQGREQYSEEEFQCWVRYQGAHPEIVRSVPGSVDFIKAARELGFTTIFITNRFEHLRQDTLNALQGLGLDEPDLNEHLYTLPESGEVSSLNEAVVNQAAPSRKSDVEKRVNTYAGDKESRRLLIQQSYDVAGYFGDNFYDFPVEVPKELHERAGLQARDEQAELCRENWGTTFFILPNPCYGSWLSGSLIPKGKLEKYMYLDGFDKWMEEQATQKH